jgi:uncharacterized protein YbaA (DUF1428 family)
MRYVDGFVVPVSKKNLPAYLRMAKQAGAIWRQYARWNIASAPGTTSR